ncbi:MULTISPECIES: AAA family ATPase [unclassified Cobetia]|uniref:AAA family ATPase n=1 Tax=unclassified Cobetia TaxID=2609414 RepID=UPI00159D46E8|nr:MULTISPECIES: AAA family ATPase [unclassified Cobetia]MCO7232625.1 AAA family ATPase [Cobetia sp. Dlab-2-AX]MCO7235899.1 AAA family ATPase [Cobetia sp. Dlab-2-U]NVN54668.1 AAA family ATPase [bacterium Scap17]
MKILALRLDNLASLAGTHEVDFEKAPLSDAGLFAITGPTGAGKSTLLDALCLALYGTTPRLDQTPGDGKLTDIGEHQLTLKDPRSLLRRGCGEGKAEVDFIGRDGLRYRASWTVSRARGKPGGRLQNARQHLQLLATGDDTQPAQTLNTTNNDAKALIIDRLGLNFAQFTRAVLLAQSEFSAFLRAKDNERSELLEKLTDTGHYSEISMAAHERERAAREAVAELERKLEGQLPASPQERQALEEEVHLRQTAMTRLSAQHDAMTAYHQWTTTAGELEQALRQAQQEQTEAHAVGDDLSRQREKLSALEALAPIRPALLRLKAIAPQHAQLVTQLAQLEQQLETLSPRVEQARAARQAADERMQRCETWRGEQLPKLEEARQLASRLAQQREAHASQLSEQQRLRDTLGQHQQELEAQDRQRQQLEQQLQQLQATLVDESGQPLRDAEEYRDQLQRQRDALLELKPVLSEQITGLARRDEVQQRLVELEQQLPRQQQALRDVAARQVQALQARDQARHEEDAERRQQEQERLARSDNVLALRRGLVQGEECPVCGSHEHPAAGQAAPAEALIAQLEQQARERLDQRRQATATAQQAMETASHEHARLEQQLGYLQQEQTQLHSELQRLQQQAQSCQTKLTELLARHSLSEHPQLEPLPTLPAAHALQLIEQRLGELDARQNTLVTTLRQLTPLREQRQALATRHATLTTQCQHGEAQLQQCETQITALAREIEQLSGTLAQQLSADPKRQHASVSDWSDWIESLTTRMRNEQEDARQALQELNDQQQQLTQQQTNLQQRQTELREEQDSLDSERSHWQAANPALDDARIAELLAVEDHELQALRQQLRSAHERVARADALREERNARQFKHWQAARTSNWQTVLEQLAAPAEETSGAGIAGEGVAGDGAAGTEETGVIRAQARQALALHARLQAHVQLPQEDAGAPEDAQPRPAEDTHALGEALAGLIAALKTPLTAVREAHQSAQAAILNDDQRRSGSAELGEQLARARAVHERWGALSELIGSASGAKFRTIAQAFNLERLIEHANLHLANLVRRYRLARGASPLGLVVVDTEMGDELRSVHSLSGGETFLVSLALALGLAGMASGELRIESLFIDEGFGSLDPDSLALAMEALDGLQASGRRVGVISHVAEMHERIPVRIAVRPSGNGQSRLEIEG